MESRYRDHDKNSEESTGCFKKVVALRMLEYKKIGSYRRIFWNKNKEKHCKFLFDNENFQFWRFKWLNEAKTVIPRVAGSSVLLRNHGTPDKVAIAHVTDLPITHTKETISHTSLDISENIHSHFETCYNWRPWRG